jgi:hypothetical protein
MTESRKQLADPHAGRYEATQYANRSEHEDRQSEQDVSHQLFPPSVKRISATFAAAS